MESFESYGQTSIQLLHFKPIYDAFCVRNGYKTLNIEEQKDLLKKYRIDLEYKMDKNTKVFSNIRWKKKIEKLMAKSSDPISEQIGTQHDIEEESSVKRFIDYECMYSNFKEDFIPMEDLNKAYDNFCFENTISQINKQNLSTSEELHEFGAIL